MSYNISVTSKGQVTIPKTIRDNIGLKTDTKATVRQLDDRSVVIEAPLSLSEIKTKIGKPSNDQPLSDSERLNMIARGLL